MRKCTFEKAQDGIWCFMSQKIFTFLDYPISLTQMSNLHFQLFGFLIGKIYGALAWKLNWVPDYWKNRQWGELNELIPPGEMFCYLILALLRGGSFL